jgi:hypothetical protein
MNPIAQAILIASVTLAALAGSIAAVGLYRFGKALRRGQETWF